jgi:general secretion pathway protein J
MKTASAVSHGGFTLIELMTALLILSLLALMSFRGLGAVLDAREHVRLESDKWRRVSAFFARFERDAQLAAPRPVRTSMGIRPAWRGQEDMAGEPRLEFSRFGGDDSAETPMRLAYLLNAQQEIELWLWPGLDMASDVLPARYPVLAGVTRMDLQYLNAGLEWVTTWPSSPLDAAIPHAVQLRIVLVSGEEIVRVFALKS